MRVFKVVVLLVLLCIYPLSAETKDFGLYLGELEAKFNTALNVNTFSNEIELKINNVPENIIFTYTYGYIPHSKNGIDKDCEKSNFSSLKFCLFEFVTFSSQKDNFSMLNNSNLILKTSSENNFITNKYTNSNHITEIIEASSGTSENFYPMFMFFTRILEPEQWTMVLVFFLLVIIQAIKINVANRHLTLASHKLNKEISYRSTNLKNRSMKVVQGAQR